MKLLQEKYYQEIGGKSLKVIAVDCYNTQGFEADKVREDFQMFFNSKEGELQWQLDYVQDNTKMESKLTYMYA